MDIKDQSPPGVYFECISEHLKEQNGISRMYSILPCTLFRLSCCLFCSIWKNELSSNKNIPLYFLSKKSKTFSVKLRQVGSNLNHLFFSFIIHIEYIWKYWTTQDLEMKSEILYFICVLVILNLLFFFPSTASGWFLEKVEITDASRNSVYCFNCNRSVDQFFSTL